MMNLLCSVFAQEHPGIHKLQLEYYNNNYNELSSPYTNEPIIDKQNRSSGPNREVFGYHPYWMGTAWQNYNYNLISTIAYFSAEATAQGNLSNLHGWPVAGLINLAHANGVNVVLCVTLFDSEDLITLLSNPSNRENLINNLLIQVQAGNADGVNVDFESFPSSQKQNMVQFITDLTNTFHTEIPGSQVTLATPAVDWNDGWDYNALATISDGLFIMGYNYYYGGSSTTGPIAPLSGNGITVSWTLNDYLNKTNHQYNKLILGCPYYGFEWSAASESSGSPTLDYGSAKFYSEMEGNALSYGKLWDESSQTPWYRYQNPNWYQGWYDDSLSLSLKYDFAIENNLLGVGMWAMGYDGNNPELWDLLSSKFITNGLHVSSQDRFTLPISSMIHSLYPNPSNSSITLDFSLRNKNDNAIISIFDLLGRPVKNVNILLNGNKNYKWLWDGTDMFNQELPAGIYFLTISVDQNIESRKITLLK